MIDIKINGSSLSLAEQRIPINFSVNDGNNIITNSQSYTFKVPATPTNQTIFDYLEDVKSVGLKQSTKPTAVIFQDGVEILRGYAKVEKAVIDKGTWYEVAIISDNGDWSNAIKKVTLRDLDWSDCVHTLSPASQYASESKTLSNTSGVTKDFILYPLINYGDTFEGIYIGQLFQKYVTVHDRLPAITMKEIIYRIFKAQGYKISSSIYSNVFDDIYIPITDNFHHEDAYRTDKLFKVRLSGDQTVNTPSTWTLVQFDTEDYDNGSDFNIGTSEYNIPQAIIMGHKIRLKLNIAHSGNIDQTIDIGLFKYRNQIPYGESLTAYFTNVTGLGNKIVDLNIPNTTYWGEVGSVYDYYIKVRISNNGGGTTTLTIDQSSTWENDPNLRYCYNQNIDFANFMFEVNQLSFLQAVKDAFNLRFWTDTKERIVYFEPEESFYNGSEVDISNRVDYSKGFDVDFFKTAKKLDYQFTKDSNDKFVPLVEKYMDNPFASHQQTMSNVYGNEDEIRTCGFSATIMDNFELIGLYNTKIPKMWSEETMSPHTNKFNLRMLYYNGQQTCNNGESWYSLYYYPDNFNLSVAGGLWTNPRTTYPQTYFYDDLTVNNNSLRFDDIGGSLGLVSKYHKYNINRLNNSRILTLNLNLDAAFINSMSFRAKYKIDSAQYPEISGYYHLIKVSNYTGGSTQCTLIQVPASDPLISTSVTGGQPITERSSGSGFVVTPTGVELRAGGTLIAKYSRNSGLDAVNVVSTLSSESKEVYARINGMSTKIKI